MTIKICDAIMGAGKSSAAINYMNAHPERRFIYITPFLGEAARIRQACPDLHFREPSNKLSEYDYKKFKHINALIQNGENITSTHSLFTRFSTDMIGVIREHGYTLIIDEDLNCLQKCDVLLADDLADQVALGRAKRENGFITFQNYENYHGAFRGIMDAAEDRELVDMYTGGDNGYVDLYYWVYPKRILEAFSEVFVLTYMFDAQTIKWYFDMEGLPYEYIHTAFDGENYTFTDGEAYVPAYVRNIKEKIHIEGTKRMNRVGDEKYALSATWYQKQGENGDGVVQLSKNLCNYYRHMVKTIPTSDRMWTTFESAKSLLRGKGYMRSDTSFNLRATNELRNKRALAYCVNVFMNPFEKNYLVSRGVQVDEDAYALSSMVQWIWRSAIRDGGEIWLYIPSSRMRELLIGWMDSFAEGGDNE